MDLAGELARFEAEVFSSTQPSASTPLPPPPAGGPHAAHSTTSAAAPAKSGPQKPPGLPPPLSGDVRKPAGLPPPPTQAKPAGLPPPPTAAPRAASLSAPPSISKPSGPPPTLVARPSGPPPPAAAAAAASQQSQYAAATYSQAPAPASAQAGTSYSYDYSGYAQTDYDSQAAYAYAVDPSQAGYANQAAYYGAAEAQQQPAASTSTPAGLNMNIFDVDALDALRESILAAPKDSKKSKKKEKKAGATMRIAGGEVWYDDTLDSWPKNDFRIFVGNLGPEVTDDVLAKSFQAFPSYAKSKVIKDSKLQKSKGYGFVSLTDAVEGAKAIRQMNNTYIGNRPCKLKKSSHETRTAPDSFKKRKAMLANPLDRVTVKRMR